MVWAGAAMGIYNLGLAAADPSKATATIGVICKDILGSIGSIIALLGVIVLPITSGDTALRSLRMSIAESFNIDQSSNKKRLVLSGIIFAIVAAILVFAKINTNGFQILWRYFAWANQTLALFAFLAITVWLFENNKGRFAWISVIPGAFYAFVTIAYIANAKIGFNLPWSISYIVGGIATVIYTTALICYGKKRQNNIKIG